MGEVLANPAVQAGVAPFIVALVIAVLLARSRLLGLTTGAAFLTVVALALGFSFESLTATRKLVLAVAGSLAVLVAIELARLPNRLALHGLVAAGSGLASLWVSWRLLAQQEGSQALAAEAGAMLFVAALVFGALHTKVSDDTVKSSSTALMLGLGSGALALLGASASLAQVGIGVAAGAGAGLLVQMITGRRASVGWTLALPAALAAGLITLLAVLAGTLPWYAPLPMLAVPWAASWLPANARPLWIQSISCALLAMAPAVLAILLAWYAGSSPGA